MDKNKWIEEKVGQWANLYMRKLSFISKEDMKLIDSFLRQSLEEAWTNGMYEIIEKRNKGEI